MTYKAQNDIIILSKGNRKPAPEERWQKEKKMRKYENEFQQELEEIDQIKRDGDISPETWELMRDELDIRYPDEDPEEADEYPLDLSEYPDFE